MDNQLTLREMLSQLKTLKPYAAHCDELERVLHRAILAFESDLSIKHLPRLYFSLGQIERLVTHSDCVSLEDEGILSERLTEICAAGISELDDADESLSERIHADIQDSFRDGTMC